MSVAIKELPEDPVLEDEQPVEESAGFEDDWLDPESESFYHEITLRVLLFLEDLCQVELFPYQREVAYRIIYSILSGDGEEITLVQSRQSGKSEVAANVTATLMVLLPRLAKAYPDHFGKFSKGFFVGVFAPTEEQAETIWGRVVSRLTTEHATNMLLDVEIDDKVGREGSKSRTIILKNSKSLCRMQTANPKAKIESKTYHFVVIDEAQDTDESMVNKSIIPMVAFYNGTVLYTGTPNRTKNVFWKAIQLNKRKDLRRKRKNHFEYDYKYVCKYNPDYRKFIAKEKEKLEQTDPDTFMLSYACKWLFDEGMFVTEEALGQLGDPRMEAVKSWWRTPVVVGIDPARTKDSTVVTVVWVDWDHPDAYGYMEHRVLDWLEITNKSWERQYFEIYNFLANYNILRIAVDSTGMGSAVADRIKQLFPNVEVVECSSDSKNQSERWKHLKVLIERQALVYPAGPKTRRSRSFKRFVQQMTELETVFQNKYMLAEAPRAPGAHDDYADSLALACYMTVFDTIQEVEVIDSPFVSYRR